MKVEELQKHATLYEVAKLLDITVHAAYKWKKTGDVPELRVYQLMTLKPEWFHKEKK
jgi:hypothetical protein